MFIRKKIKEFENGNMELSSLSKKMLISYTQKLEKLKKIIKL